jgi:hypothetical protein
MEYVKAFNLIKELEFDSNVVFFSDKKNEIHLLRPSKQFKSYNIKKNFQIFLKEDNRNFRPNHLRIMIDLHLRVRSRPDLKKELLLSFDKIFHKEDPDLAIEKIKNEHFEHYLNSLSAIANLSQLFLIEQEYNYERESNYNPPTLFYQGWIRQFIDSSKEIDNLTMSVCKGQPPASKYTALENRKNKKFNEGNPELWYLQS